MLQINSRFWEFQSDEQFSVNKGFQIMYLFRHYLNEVNKYSFKSETCANHAFYQRKCQCTLANSKRRSYIFSVWSTNSIIFDSLARAYKKLFYLLPFWQKDYNKSFRTIQNNSYKVIRNNHEIFFKIEIVNDIDWLIKQYFISNLWHISILK